MSEHWTIWVCCPDCGKTNMHAETCGAFPGEPVVHGNRVEVVRADAVMTRVDIKALREVLVPFLTLDRDIGDEWSDVCEKARHVHEATGEQ